MLDCLEKPYSNREIKKLSNNGKNYITGRVAVECNELFDGLESFLDTLSRKLVGDDLLMDISYKVVGGEGSTIAFEVTGDVSEVLITYR